MRGRLGDYLKPSEEQMEFITDELFEFNGFVSGITIDEGERKRKNWTEMKSIQSIQQST